ncbi:hypothetical protein L6R53_10815 [Myxococcota bacterium]|nr:hypothetical protein [Myxococcota bacterium]
MLPLLLSLSLPAAAWTAMGERDGCVYSKQDEGAVIALRAECTWDLPAERVRAKLADWSVHDDVFESVAESRVLGSLQGGAGKVYQRHQASGISDREIVMDVKELVIDGGWRWTHSKSADQSQVTGQHVLVGRDDGLWELKPTANGGSFVVYELRYDPAGSVPGFMVKWFQGSGFRDMLLQLRTAAAAG